MAMNRPRLGRGLGSLISSSPLNIEAPADLPPSKSAQVPSKFDAGLAEKTHLEIPVSHVAPNPHQPRRKFSERKLAELAESIKSHGLIQPIVVRRVDGSYQLIAGERRLRAAKLAGQSTVSAIVKDVADVPQAEMALAENIQREDLNPIERAMAYQRIMADTGTTQEDLARRLGEDRSSIANHLRILHLQSSVQELVAEGRLSLGHAKVLAGIADGAVQQRFADVAVDQGLSVRALEQMVADNPPEAAARSTPAPSAHLQSLEKSISGQIGMRVQVHSSGKGKGRLVIHYASLDQFDELLQRMKVQLEET